MSGQTVECNIQTDNSALQAKSTWLVYLPNGLFQPSIRKTSGIFLIIIIANAQAFVCMLHSGMSWSWFFIHLYLHSRKEGKAQETLLVSTMPFLSLPQRGSWCNWTCLGYQLHKRLKMLRNLKVRAPNYMACSFFSQEGLYKWFFLFTGKVPGSPGPSPFSSLPDMSPKKVSAKHNVYVSPLRSSKVCF